jgi:DNA polymerase-3 subunit epsilon
MRQIILDTETTGLDPSEGHRIIEIGCVEMIDRKLTGNNFHQYLQPDHEIDEGAIQVHGISNEFLQDKPRFAEIMDDFMQYVKGAELIIHNAPFDIGFLDTELRAQRSPWGDVTQHCQIVDTLVMAKKRFPGKRNSLDALCKRYFIDNSHRTLHGALLDSEILADVYLLMTGGQVSLTLQTINADGFADSTEIRRIDSNRDKLCIIQANEEELLAHAERLEAIQKKSGLCVWNN